MTQIVTTSNLATTRSRFRTKCFIAVATLAVIAFAFFMYKVLIRDQESSGKAVAGLKSQSAPIKDRLTISTNEALSKSMTLDTMADDNGLSITDASLDTALDDHSEDGMPSQETSSAIEENNEDVFVAPRTKRKKVFDNRVENILETLSTPGRRFGVPPASLKMSKEEVLDYLRRPVQILEDDDEQTVSAKERTAAMKTEAIKYIENGGSFDDFVQEMIKISSEEAEYLDQVRKEKRRIVEEEGIEAAQAYLDQVNPKLRESGLKELSLSDIDRNRAAKADAARDALNQTGDAQ